MATKKPKKGPEAPRSLASIQVDVTTRLGAVAAATTTGMPAIDELLGGGLRSGTHLLVHGAPGVGKTAFVLMLAYMAARSRAAVLFSSVGLDETEVVARLTARALHREYQNVAATYGTIWSGLSMQDPALRGPISSSVNTVTKKVGEHLHLHCAEPLQDVATLGDHAAFLWARNERVLLVVDGIEPYSAAPGSSSSPSYDGRLSLVAHELSRLASQGCAVITTCNSVAAAFVMPAVTVAAELRAVREPVPRGGGKKKQSLGARPMDLAFQKNRLGPTPTLPLLYVPAASVFEQRGI